MRDKILILDFGSQVTHLIARRVREIHVYSEVHSYDISDSEILAFSPKGIILSGGPNSAFHGNIRRAPDIVFNLGVPVLGICFGMQTMAQQLGGTVATSSIREYGHAELHIHTQTPLLDGIEDNRTEGISILNVWMSHGDMVTCVPNGFDIIASTQYCPIAAIANEKRKLYGVQFHPEVTHTIKGNAILQRFILEICNARPDWEMVNYVEEIIKKIQFQVGNEKVILGLSGGIDSCVTAVLLHRAIGDKLTCVFIDHGLLRLNKYEQQIKMFARKIGIKVIYVNATDIFIKKLEGITDPEKKRKIIGHEFVEAFKLEAAKLPGTKWLAQGTIYSDVIESSDQKNRNSVNIKSHHNVGGLPKNLHLKLIEPIRELFKDEVRQLGIKLGLSENLMYQHPFPGPGLGIRILGEVKREFIDLLRLADSIFIEILHETIEPVSGKTWYRLTSQAFALLLPIQSVGVMGDTRTYEYVIALRAVQTQDFMSANWAYLPHELLDHISNRIINEVQGINRVVYDISGKPPSTIEWE